MPEERPKATKAEATKTGSTATQEDAASEGTITYEDHGDYILETDTRGGAEVVTRRAKSLNAIPVDQATHDSVQARVDIEKEAAENEGRDPESVNYQVPPVEDPDAEPETVTVTAEGSK